MSRCSAEGSWHMRTGCRARAPCPGPRACTRDPVLSLTLHLSPGTSSREASLALPAPLPFPFPSPPQGQHTEELGPAPCSSIFQLAPRQGSVRARQGRGPQGLALGSWDLSDGTHWQGRTYRPPRVQRCSLPPRPMKSTPPAWQLPADVGNSPVEMPGAGFSKPKP